MPENADAARRENLGPAERILRTLITHADHITHNRPGIVTPDGRASIGVRWQPVSHKEEDGAKVVYRLERSGRRNRRGKIVERRVRIGTLDADGNVVNGRVVGRYQPAGLFPEAAAWYYGQIADVWKMDNEFAARWASYQYVKDHRDMKMALAAFMLVQSRRGDPVVEDGEVILFDQDFRAIGEAMCLLYDKKQSHDLNPKLLLRIRSFLRLPEIAALNYELGFAKSDRKPFLGRWPKVVRKWLRFREDNLPLLEGLVKGGYRTTVIELARVTGYKPTSPRFFEILRWKQKQSDEGHRTLAIGAEVARAEDWSDLSEREICEKIETREFGYKRIAALLPREIGLTRAILAACIEAETLSNKDLVILTPTIEALGLLDVQNIRQRWERACQAAEDQRAANIAKNVRSETAKATLDASADAAVAKAVEEAVKNIRVYFMVDASASMQGAIEKAKDYAAKILTAFPEERVHIAAFNHTAREIALPALIGKRKDEEDPTKKAALTKLRVQQAFTGIRASGGTRYFSAVNELAKHRPAEDEDVLFWFIGDEDGETPDYLAQAIHASGLNPTAFAFVRVVAEGWADYGRTVRGTASRLGIPCIQVEETTFDDVYAIPRVLRNLIASTPVRQSTWNRPAPRATLVDTILKTELLKRPAWAEPGA